MARGLLESSGPLGFDRPSEILLEGHEARGRLLDDLTGMLLKFSGRIHLQARNLMCLPMADVFLEEASHGSRQDFFASA
jgi:hypothetical protein